MIYLQSRRLAFWPPDNPMINHAKRSHGLRLSIPVNDASRNLFAEFILHFNPFLSLADSIPNLCSHSTLIFQPKSCATIRTNILQLRVLA